MSRSSVFTLAGRMLPWLLLGSVPAHAAGDELVLGVSPLLSEAETQRQFQPLCDYLGIDVYAANRLEFVNGYATGRLLPPVMASATKAKWIREFAEKEDINLSKSYAYSDSISDLAMLSIVGHPVAVNPDFRLKQTALQHDWAILDLR